MIELSKGPRNQLPLVLFFNQAALAGSSRSVAQSSTAPQANQCPLLCFPDFACSVLCLECLPSCALMFIVQGFLYPPGMVNHSLTVLL